MSPFYACGSAAHTLSRRQLLAGLGTGAVGTLGLGGLLEPIRAGEVAAKQKRVLMIWLSGGVSQLETWDPKPATNTGGPFQAISTSVTGTQICELLPYTAQQMHRLAIVRGVNTKSDDHGVGTVIMHTGRKREPAMEYPHLGSLCARLLSPDNAPLPGYLHITPKGAGGFGKQDAAYLGPKYASITLSDGKPPTNLLRPDTVTDDVDQLRLGLRTKINDRFAQARKSAETEAYVQSYEQAAKLTERKNIFDTSRTSPKDAERYGTGEFGRHCLLARRLLEEGISFVKVTHSNYDTHYENFDFHIEQLGEFDRPFASLIDDLQERGLLDSTLVLVLSEFGRTPTINRNYGRDHWSRAWSIALGGCGIKGGAVVGKTNANGTAVTDREVHGGHLYHTYLRALGINSTKKLYHNRQPIHIADPEAEEIKEVLA